MKKVLVIGAVTVLLGLGGANPRNSKSANYLCPKVFL